MSLDNFITKYGGWTESYKFYNGEVELRYDKKAHVYLLVKGEELIPQEGVTSIVHIIDKSDALIPWGCKMMAMKLLATMPSMTLPLGDKVVPPDMVWADFEKLVLEAKAAHKEKLEEAASVGHTAHEWIERYIKAVIAGEDGHVFRFASQLPDDERARNCIKAALDWMDRHSVKWICTERKIYSRKHGYAGTMDGMALVSSCGDPLCCPSAFTDRLSVIDWKTSNYLYLEYLYQTAAYEAAQEEELGLDIQDRWVIRLGKDNGEFEPWHVEPEQFEDDFNGFLLCLHLTRSVANLKQRIKDKSIAIKHELKLRAKAEKEAALKIACKNSGKYKGTRKPTCNDGNPCQACLTKYAEVQAAKCEAPLVRSHEIKTQTEAQTEV